MGITAFAQEQLGDVVYVQLPAWAVVWRQEGPAAWSNPLKPRQIYAPASGTVIGVNQELAGSPELINNDPYNAGWILRVQLDDPAQLDSLLDAAAYDAQTRGAD